MDDGRTLRPVGRVRSSLTDPAQAPGQLDEDAPPAVVEIDPPYRAAIDGLQSGDDVLVLTWLHLGDRDALTAHPRGDPSRPEVGVFATRSPSRPNPIGVHRTRLTAIGSGGRLEVAAMEAVDGTPVLDVRPVLRRPQRRAR